MPVINPFGVVAGTLSAGTTKATLGEVVFSNSNGVSFGINGQTITASVAAGGGGNTGSISAGTTEATLGQVVFSNSNGMSFGVNGQTITGSYTVPSIAGLLSNINVSAGTTSNNLSAVTFNNGNGVSFGLNGSVVTASVATSLTAVNISAGTTSNNLSALTFNNGNGVSFGLNGSVVTGSIATSLTAMNISAGTTSNNLSAVTFANSNNISFGLNGSVVTATVTWPIATQVYDVGSVGSTGTVTRYAPEDHRHAGIVRNGVSNVGNTLGNTGASHGQFIFAASGNATASMSTGAGGIHTIWYSVAPQTNQTVGLYATGNTTGQSSSSTFDARTLTFVGQGIVSVGFSNGSVNISAVGGGGGNTGSISAGTTRLTLGEAVFADSNGVSFGVNGQTVTASIATSLTAVNISAGTTSNNLSAFTFSNGSNVSFGLNGSVITASVATSLTAVNVSAGTTSNNLSAITFSNLNGVTFGLNGSVVTASVAAGGGLTNINVSAGTTSNNLSALTFNDLNGISFGLNASTITASYTVPTVTNSSWTVSDAASSATVARLAFTNLNGVTLSLSTGAAGSHTIVGSVATSLTNIRVSAGTTSNNLSAITFSNGSNVSFGLNGSVITASVNTSLTNINVSAGTTSNNLSAITFSNGSNVSFGLNGSVVTASVNTSLTAINVSAGTTSNNLSAITFSNLNGLTFGLNASVITGSYTVPGTLSVFAQSNTTQSSSGTIAFNSLQFNGAGIASVGVSNGSVIISVPAGGGAGMSLGISTQGNTSGTTGLVSNQYLLVGSNGITLSQSVNGQSATLTISGDGYSIYSTENFPRVSLTNLSNMTLTILTQRPIFLPLFVPGSLTHNLVDIEVSRATSGSNAFTMQAAIYTFVNSTQISRLASLQNVFSNTDTGSISGIRRIRLTGFEAAGSTLSPGHYVLMLYASAAATASMNYSYRGQITAAPDVGVLGGGTNVVTTATSAMSNGGFRAWMGVWSTTTASPPAAVTLSNVSQHTNAIPIYFYMGRT